MDITYTALGVALFGLLFLNIFAKSFTIALACIILTAWELFLVNSSPFLTIACICVIFYNLIFMVKGIERA